MKKVSVYFEKSISSSTFLFRSEFLKNFFEKIKGILVLCKLSFLSYGTSFVLRYVSKSLNKNYLFLSQWGINVLPYVCQRCIAALTEEDDLMDRQSDHIQKQVAPTLSKIPGKFILRYLNSSVRDPWHFGSDPDADPRIRTCD